MVQITWIEAISRLSETAADGRHPGAGSLHFCGSHLSGLQETQEEE